LTIEAEWEWLERGSPEERAAFAAIGIRFGDIWLTEAEDAFVKRIRQRVHLSGYHLAEWFAWNWWRLRWEPRRRSHDWAMAHRMATIGAGYVWPNITIVSDGERIVLDAEPTAGTASEPLRYVSRNAAVARASEFESAVDAFVEQVIGQLREEGVSGSNLETIWADLSEERATVVLARRRKLEALLGQDAGEGDDALVDRLLRDVNELGERAVEELAADRTGERPPATSSDIRELARQRGFDFNPRNVVRLQDRSQDSLPTNVPAWQRGVAAALALRQQEQLGAAPISNDRLCQLTGVTRTAVQPGERTAPFSFALDEGPSKGAVVLRSVYETGRRFNLARLLGDRVAAMAGGQLFPATRTYTYRQKLQRAFAGEFLCPFEALADTLHGDFSVEAIDRAAAHFNVSERTVRTLLANHGLIDREDIVGDFDMAA
jgi:hypothetical protein